MWDVAIVGSGPAGASCAAFCARAGLRTLVLERATFPREKVCGDCLNPACWPVLERLGVATKVRAASHGKLSTVEFIDVNGRSIKAPLPNGENAAIAIRRSVLDQILLRRARSLGAEVREGETLLSLERGKGWRVRTDHSEENARLLVAADGRNSSVARLCVSCPAGDANASRCKPTCRFRLTSETELSCNGCPTDTPVRPMGEDLLNVCLVTRPEDLLRSSAGRRKRLRSRPTTAGGPLRRWRGPHCL